MSAATVGEESASSGLPEELNLADRFLAEALRRGDGERVALVCGPRRLTYRQLAELTGRFSALLRERGVRQEERVFLALPDGPEFVAAFFAALGLGAVVVMLNPALGAERIAAIVAYGRPSAAVTGETALPGFLQARRSTGWPRLLITSGPPAGGDARFPEDAPEEAEVEIVPTHRDDPAIWLFSGGTTGLPKAVVQTHGSFVHTTRRYALDTLGYGPDDRTLSVPKLFFGYATGSNLLFPFAAGGSSVLFPEHPTAELLFEQIRRHRPTILIHVPTMIRKMVEHPAAADQDLSCLRFATSAGEALPVSLDRRWRETFGVELLDGLGTAEMWHIFVTNRPGEVRPGTLGRVVDGFELAVRDADGRDLPEGEVGGLWVRGASRALGYWQDLPSTAATFRGEWVVTGDLVRRDADGFVTYCGRDDDVLKVGGRWLAPGEVESCLLTHPAVNECVVLGLEDDDGLTRPCAVVVPGGASAGPSLEEELRAWALERLEAYKHPRRVFLLDELPRTHLGKTDRGALKRRFAGELGE